MNKKELPILQMLEDIKGDKIILTILMLLIIVSMLSISSSTSMLALELDMTRLDIIREQVFTIAVGLGITALVYFLFKYNHIKALSRWGFVISFCLLMILILRIKLPGIIEVGKMNEAERIIKVFGMNIHVVEVIKLGMIMYTAWAISSYHENELKWGKILHSKIATRKPQLGKLLTTKTLNKWIYIYFPIGFASVIAAGMSLFTSIFIIGLCGVMIVIGKILRPRYVLHFAIAAAAVSASVMILNRISDGGMFSHLQSSLNRFDIQYEKALKEADGTADFQKVLDKVRQPISAKYAIKEGGLFGKGPGNSTQKYVVPIIYEDYMFAFIVEEYGIFGVLLVLILYSSLLARGNIIVRNIREEFGKMAVVGIVFLISGQAMFHILMNIGIFPISGQTLPMISHGKFSFWIFSAAFGVLLNLSKLGKENIERETKQSAPILESDLSEDNIRSSMDELDKLQ